MHYFTHYGDNLIGNLILGAHMGQQASERQYRAVNREHYPEIARKINTLPDHLGSSVAGEQPKFTIFNGQEHLIIKYSPQIQEDNPVATRHPDLMVCEHLALESLRAHGIVASESVLYIDDRFYLEMRRFDRIGSNGRRGMASLKSIDAEYTGKNQDWPEIAKALLDEKLISQDDFFIVETTYAFGRYIANTDMHNGNFSFFIEDLSLAGVTPIYDMLPMAYMPVQGELRNPNIEAPRFINVSREANQKARDMAVVFWNRVVEHSQISEHLKSVTKRFHDSLIKTTK